MSGPDEPTSIQPMPDPAQDAVASLLVDVLNTEAARIEPTDRLAEIRAAGASRRLSWGPVAAAAAAVLVVGGGTWALVDRNSGDKRPSVAASSTATPTPSVSATASPSGSSGPSAGLKAVTVPVYYPGSQVKGLFREFQRTQAPAGQQAVVQRALQLATDPTAPTKSGDVSRWLPGTSGRLVAEFVNDETLAVQVPAAEGQANGRSAEDARLAAQQLVWTATAVMQDPQLKVQIVVGQNPRTELFGSLPLYHRSFTRPPAGESYLDLSAIWILQPEPGSAVRGPIVVSGQACTFEANVAWQVLRGGKVVQSGQTTAAQGCPVRSAWSVTVRGLAPGAYLFRAYDLSAKDGKSYDGLDTTTFTVR